MEGGMCQIHQIEDNICEVVKIISSIEDELWREVCARFTRDRGEAIFYSHLKDIVYCGIEGNTAILRAINTGRATLIDERYGWYIRGYFKEVTEGSVTKLKIIS
jgi:hypothetical protein